MHNYPTLVKHNVKDDCAVIFIDNSDLVKSASTKLKALSEIRGGSTDEITLGYLAIRAVVLPEKGEMPLLVYRKVFSAVERGFISEPHENLSCLESLSENFSIKDAASRYKGAYCTDFKDKSSKIAFTAR